MVKIDELSDSVQKKIRDLFEAIQRMKNRPEYPGFGPVYMIPEYYAVLLLKNIRDGADSWEFVNRPDDIKALKDFLYDNNRIRLLRNLLEIEYTLNRLPAEKPCYA